MAASSISMSEVSFAETTEWVGIEEKGTLSQSVYWVDQLVTSSWVTATWPGAKVSPARKA